MQALLSSIIVVLLSINITMASEYEAVNSFQKSLDLVEQDSSIDPNLTCVDEYLKRAQKLRKFLIWAPPITLVGAPVAGAVVGFGTAGLMSLTNITGWSALGYTVGGAMLTTGATLATFLVLETVKGIEYANIKKIVGLIAQSHALEYEGKYIKKYLKKYNRKYKRDNLTAQELANYIVNLDESGKLCNGELSKKPRSNKLKNLLAKKKGIFKYIHADITNID